jgi:hypothetical protein
MKLLEFAEEIDFFVRTDKGDEVVNYSEATKEYGKGIRASTDVGSRKVREAGLALKLAGLWDS